MNCDEISEKIELYVLGGLSASEHAEIEAHLADCPRCQAVNAEYRQLVADLQRANEIEPPRLELQRNILRSVEQEIRQSAPNAAGPRSLRLARLAVPAAACLLAGLVYWQFWLQRDTISTPDLPGSTSPAESSLPSYSIPAEARAVPTSPADNMVVRGHYVYLLLDDGVQANVAAIDSLTGQEKWRSDVETLGYLIADQMGLYCLAPGRKGGLDLVGMDWVDGSTKWRFPQPDYNLLHGVCPPAVLPGGRICWTTNTDIHVLGSSDGQTLWTGAASDENLLSVATVEGTRLYVAGIAGLYCFDIASGTQLWQAQYGFPVSRWARPLAVAQNGRICVGLRSPQGQSKLFCLDLTNQRLLWTRAVAQISHLCIAGNRLFLRSGGVQALSLADGERLWDFASTGCSPLTYTEGHIWFVDSADSGRLISLYEQTGVRISDMLGIRSCNAFVEVDGKGYVKTHDGSIHVVLLKRWQGA